MPYYSGPDFSGLPVPTLFNMRRMNSFVPGSKYLQNLSSINNIIHIGLLRVVVSINNKLTD